MQQNAVKQIKLQKRVKFTKERSETERNLFK